MLFLETGLSFPEGREGKTKHKGKMRRILSSSLQGISILTN